MFAIQNNVDSVCMKVCSKTLNNNNNKKKYQMDFGDSDEEESNDIISKQKRANEDESVSARHVFLDTCSAGRSIRAARNISQAMASDGPGRGWEGGDSKD